MLVLVNSGGEPFSMVQVHRLFTPVAVSHSLALAASLDERGYSVSDIIHILMAEGGQPCEHVPRHCPPLHRATDRMVGMTETEKGRSVRNTVHLSGHF